MFDCEPILGLQTGKVVPNDHDVITRPWLIRQANNPDLRIPVGLEDIIDRIQSALDVELPLDYLFDINRPLGRDLRWQDIYDPNALDRISLGFDPFKNPEDFPNAQEALAVIETHGRLQTRLRGRERRITPQSITITGLVENSSGQSHIVTIDYPIEDHNDPILCSLQLSLPPEFSGKPRSDSLFTNTISEYLGLLDRAMSVKFEEIYPHTILTRAMSSATKSHDAIIKMRVNYPPEDPQLIRFNNESFYDTVSADPPNEEFHYRSFGPCTVRSSGSLPVINYKWKIDYPAARSL